MNRTFLTAAEVANELRCSPAHIYRMCRDGELEHRRFGKRVLIPARVITELAGLSPASTSPVIPLRENADAVAGGVDGSDRLRKVRS